MNSQPGSVNANPTRRFFIENFTRDLSLEDALLDLIDNSIDACIRMNHLTLSMKSLLSETPEPITTLGIIEVNVSESMVEIIDNCGGIEFYDAKHSVFRFGREGVEQDSYLGIYGIGLKRGVFKIGKDISIESKTLSNGFKVDIDVDSWIADPSPDWSFPFVSLSAAATLGETGTKIIVNELNPHIADTIKGVVFLNSLKKSIETAYALFLSKYVIITINGVNCSPITLPLTQSEQVKVGRSEKTIDGVEVQIFAGIADRKRSWSTDTAGWYVLCNGRLVLHSNKSSITGWGNLLPQFHTKYNGFLGYVFFFSHDLLKMPWTTTKRDIDVESPIYIQVRNEMAMVAKPVLTFLSEMYPNDPEDEVVERHIVDKLSATNFETILSKEATQFVVRKSGVVESTTVNVSFKVEKRDLEKVKLSLGDIKMSAGNAGKHTFEYYLKHECFD